MAISRETVLCGIAGAVGLGAAAASFVLVGRKLFRPKSSEEVCRLALMQVVLWCKCDKVRCS